MARCPACDGTGWTKNLGACNRCNGTGKISKEVKPTCSFCGKTKYFSKKHNSWRCDWCDDQEFAHRIN